MKDLLLLSMLSFLLLNCRSMVTLSFYLIFLFIYQFYKRRLLGYHFIFLIFLYIISFSNFCIRNNCVLETHENYVVASVNHQRVLIYTDEIYFENEEVIAEGELKKIEADSNFNLFNFKEHMNQKNIYGYYENAQFIKKDSLKRRMYEHIMTMDEAVSSILLRIFYQFGEYDMIYSSGLHLTYLNRTFLQFLLKICSFSSALTLSSVLVGLFGFLFPFKFVLFRILCGNIIKMIFKVHSHKERLGLQYLLCMLFDPGCVFSLVFLIPYFLSLIQIFTEKRHQRKASVVFLIFLQFFKTSQCQPLSILLFPFIQIMNGGMLIAEWMQLLMPIPLISSILEIFLSFSQFLSSFVFYGAIPIGLTLLFLYFFFQMLHQKRSFLYSLILLYIPLQSYLNPFYQVTMINVGQGDSILIQAPFHQHNILIDLPSNKEERVIDYLRSIGVYHIDTLIFTHPDSDHNGGKKAFLERFKVHDIVEGHQDIHAKNISLVSLNHATHDNENDNSLVHVASLGHLSYCFMGDASVRVEKEIMMSYDLSCDVLKIGHHGSKTSTDPLFIQKIQPSYALISAGKDNRYGHPHEDVLSTLEKYDVKTYVSALDGAVSIKSFLNFHFIRTSGGDFGIMVTE